MEPDMQLIKETSEKIRFKRDNETTNIDHLSPFQKVLSRSVYYREARN